MPESKQKRSQVMRPLRDAVVLGLVVLLAATASIVFFTWRAANAQTSLVRTHLVELATVVSLQIDGDLFERLVSEPGRPSALYTQIVMPMTRIHRHMPNIRYLYTMTDDDGQPRFVTDTAWYAEQIGRIGETEPSEIWSAYDEADPEMLEALRNGVTIATRRPYSDEYGTFMSGYAPIFNAAGGHVGIVGMDMDAGLLATQLSAFTKIAAASIGFSALLAGAVAWFVWRERLRQLRDHDERQRITAALEDSETRFRSVAEAAGEYIWECDLNGRYIMLSERVREVLGYRPEEMIGRFPWEFVPEDAAAAYRNDVLGKFASGGKLTQLVHPKQASDGRIVWLSVSGVPFHDAAGRLAGYRGTGGDVTAQREFVERLKEAKQAAETADRAKSDFLAVMSHEIRTPMNGVIGFANLLANTRLDEQQREYVETIQESGEALLVLINEILDFSKIESGHMTLESAPFNVRNCIYGVLNLTAHSASRKDIELLGEFDDDVPQWVVGDVARLRQVLINLVGNAIKFTSHGQVVVAVTVLKKVSREVGTEYRLGFKVRDTGIGISPERMDKLFRPFSQADTSMTRKFGGTGLGLAICKRLVTLMGGDIGVRSQPGEGSVFHFDIVAMEAEESAGGDACGGVFDVQKRLLVVAADGGQTDQLIANLRNWGVQAEIVRTTDGAAGMLAGDMAFDGVLVVVDGRGADVFEPANRLRAVREDVPFILVGEDAARTASEDGGARYLAGVSTPIATEQLFEAVAQVLSQSDGALSRRVREARQSFGVGDAKPAVGLRILLAEDNKVNMRVARLMLEKLGCEADGVVNGRKAFEQTGTGGYDLVLMDLQMPEMDGIEATRAIRERERQLGLGPIQIIALTADAMQGDRERALAAGMDDYLTKPLKPEPLKEALAKARERMREARNQPLGETT